eukprot:250668_1
MAARANDDSVRKRWTKKYAQFCITHQRSKAYVAPITDTMFSLFINQNDNESLCSDNETIQYDFGIRFYYLNTAKDSENTPKNHTPVQKKYSCLKEELLRNPIAQLTIQQFNHEYSKSVNSFNSRHCKTHFRPYTQNKHQISGVKHQNPHITIDHLLCMMIYCNYTDLQHLFSKTYRINVDLHNNYYHLGKFLKDGVHKFGSSIKKAKGKKFYHGIGKSMTFPSYIANICICCPLSTSASFSVATNFTNANNGMVIEFASTKQNTKYISLAWVSDYPSENE